jgi:hypothetical protein
MPSPADSRDDEMKSGQISFLVLFGVYLLYLAFASYKLFRSRNEARIFRVIKGMIVAFLVGDA